MLNNTNRYAKKHGTGSSSGGTTIILGGQSQANIPLDLNVDSITANKGDISKLIAHSANINDANIIYLMSGAGQITKINGDELNYEEGYIGKLTTDELEANTLTVNNTAQIKSLIAEYIQSNDIHTDYLTVNKSAHFFELIIDKIRSVQGTQINTAANCIADYVEAYDSSDNLVQPDSNNVSYYRIYWRNIDDDGRAVRNEWLKYDQALCETFNVNTGTSYDVSNKYYWRLVNNTSNESGETIRYVNFNTKAVSNVAITNYVIELDDFEFEVTDTTSDSYEYVCDNFEISSQISDQWDAETNEWTVTSTVYGLQMKMMNSDDEYVGLTGGIFSFSTNIPTRLNVGFYYDDNTFEFFPADDSYKTAYSCQSHNNAAIEAIVITSATVETYEACNWIDLSNTDMDQTLSGKSAIPSVGDNISQLGYRYTSLPNYQNTDSWRNAHKDDIARASAIIIAAYQTPDSGVFPPSYAQYKNITDYNLSSHRHTYFDAQGSKFYGNFYIGTGDNTGSYTPVSDLDAEVYKIVPNYDIITKDVNDVVTPSTLTCQFLVPNQANLSNTVPTGCSFNYTIDNGSPVIITAGNTVSINISNMSSNIILVLTKNNVIMDQITKSVVEIDVANGENGLNAPQTQWAYKNATSINSSDYPTAANSDTYINDWTSAAVPLTAQQISSGYATWQRQRTNTWTLVNNVNVKSYGQWSDAIRITGQNGQPGEDGDPGTAGADGKYTEFIYKHFTSAQTFGNNNNNPAYWTASQTQDYTGPSGYQWNDHPQGITETYKYEYMSQREYDGTAFGTFTTPVIWSKWGEKGQDGDGYEYIYQRYENEQTWGSNNNNPAYWAANQDDEYLGPTGYQWVDDPIGVTSTYKYEYVSVRKKTNGTWGKFSTPALWSRYAAAGSNGGRYQFMYANYNPSVASTKPTIIPNGSTEYTITQLTNAGWARVPSTPDFEDGEYTYMTQAFFNDGQTSSVWTTPTRITGENGKDGEDGNSIEFVYCHTQSKITNISSFGNVNYQTDDRFGTYAYEPDYQPTTFADNSYWDWTDNPQGVDGISYNYEYMMTREWSKNNTADTDRSYWSVFSTPVIWSSYGEKGMDGDGYEYVFLKHWDSTCPTIYDDDTYTKSGATISKADDDYCPYSTVRGQKVRWNDEPDEPDATGKYVFVSMRKKTNGAWGNFTTGKLWTWYVEDGEPGEEGPQGEQGPQGPAGQNAVKYELVDQDSYANVIMDLDANNNIVSQLDISLKFRIARREGTTVRYMNASEMTGMAVYYRISKSTNSASSYYYYKLNLTTSGDTIAEYSITYTSSNDYVINANKDIIVALVGSTNSSISDANITNYTMHDTVNLITTLQPNATLQIVKGQNASIKTLVTGQSGLAQQYSTLSQTMSGIQTDVVSLTNDVGGLETNMSTIQQTAEGVNSVVKSMYGLKDGVNLNLIKLSTFENISDTFGPNNSFKTSSPNNGYWWAQKSSENSSLLFTGFVQGSSVSYLGNSSLELNSYNFNYSSSGSPNADIDYKILNEQINTDSSSQKYCFSIYVKKKNTIGQNRVLLQVSGLSSSGSLTDWTNKNNRSDESNVTANTIQVTSGSFLYQQFELNDTDWHRLFITFTAGSTTTSPIVGFRIYRNASDSNPSTSTNYYNIAMPKCEKSAKPTDWTYITDETTLSSQITQTATTVSISAINTIINGDLDLHGTFTSENTGTMNKTVIDADQGGMTFYGPSSVEDDDHSLPGPGAVQRPIVKVEYGTDPDALSRIGMIEILNANNSNEYIDLIASDGIEIAGVFDKLYLTEAGVAYSRRDTASQDFGSDSVWSDWQTIIGKGHNGANYTYNRTIQPDEDFVLVTGGSTFTLPQPTFGKQIIIFNNTSSSITINAGSGDNIIGRGYASQSSSTIGSHHCETLVYSAGEGMWYIINYT